MAVSSVERHRARGRPTPVVISSDASVELLGRRHDAADWPALAVARAEPQRSAARRAAQMERRTVAVLVAIDAGVGLIAGLAGVLLRSGQHPTEPAELAGVPYLLLLAIVPAIWTVTVLLGGGYDRRYLITGPEEFRRIVNAGVWLLASIGFLDFLTRIPVSRLVVAVTIPLVTVLTIAARCAARAVIHHRLRQGRALHRVVVLGTPAEVRDLVRHMRRCPQAGYEVVGACVDSAAPAIDLPDGAVPVLGTVARALDSVRDAGADTVAVAGTGAVRNGDLRRLSWRLEGTGIRLVVAPAITDVAGPRIVVRPIAGLPLLHVEEPEFTGSRRVLKSVIDRSAALVLAALASPVIAVVAVAIRLNSTGPVFFRQERVGLHGQRFRMLKFRTMCEGAEGIDLAHLNDCDGPLFKMRCDPRVTSVGRWLRRYSIDELPQLWNVVTGSMSLVGPRPRLPAEVEMHGNDGWRRLLVKPGMTGLWQVSGRSDLPWDEAVRLDLHYIENWSVGMDLTLLGRTLAAVVRGQGAY